MADNKDENIIEGIYISHTLDIYDEIETITIKQAGTDDSITVTANDLVNAILKKRIYFKKYIKVSRDHRLIITKKKKPKKKYDPLTHIKKEIEKLHAEPKTSDNEKRLINLYQKKAEIEIEKSQAKDDLTEYKKRFEKERMQKEKEQQERIENELIERDKKQIELDKKQLKQEVEQFELDKKQLELEIEQFEQDKEQLQQEIERFLDSTKN